jgi:IS5 family transposase
MMLESITLLVFFQNLGLKMPGRSTLTELVNAVTNKTRMLILDAQVALVLKLGLDDFTVMLQDSTHVDSNTKWPTDSSLIRALVEGLLRVGQSLIHLGLPPVDFEGAHRVLLSITRLDREIGLLSGKKEGGRDRRRRYEKLLKKAKRAQALVTQQMEPIGTALTAFDRPPSRKELAVRAVERIRRDLNSLGQAISACEARVVRNEKVPMSGKVLSISDPDASFIAKGQREPVVGYKPQIARSGAGFITGLLLPKGNAADSDQLLPMVREVMGRTHIDLAVITVDDGYSSAANMQFLKAPDLKIPVVSINGAKGHALTLKANWDSDEYAAARNLRSAVESLIFTLKQGFGFGEVARRSLAAVHAELLEKALAYNLCHMVRRRQVEFAKQRPEQATA